MNGIHKITLGDRGRLVVPAGVRERAGLAEGSVVMLVETDEGLVLMTQGQLRDRVRADLHGTNLVDALLVERREAARAEDASVR